MCKALSRATLIIKLSMKLHQLIKQVNKDYGFKNLHIVDLDGALTGKTVNLHIIKEISNQYDLKIEIGGGIRTLDSIKKYIDSKKEKVILGSGAIKNKEFLKRLVLNLKIKLL